MRDDLPSRYNFDKPNETPLIQAILEAAKNYYENNQELSPEQHMDSIIDHLKSLYRQPLTIHEANEEIQKFLANVHKETRAIVEKKMTDQDEVTKLARRDGQNDAIREAIFSRKNEDGEIKGANNVGFISFDLRALKVVNDATKDHRVGDMYLERVALGMREVSNEIKSMLDVNISLGRDGGDEFSMLITSNGINLDEDISGENISENAKKIASLPEIQQFIKERKLQIIEDDGKTTTIDVPITLMDALTELVNKRMSEKKHSDLFLNKEQKTEYDRLLSEGNSAEAEQLARSTMHEVLFRHVNKGAEENEIVQVPENFELYSHVATGGATLSEIINNPTSDDFKKMETPRNGRIALEQLAGALRSRSDIRSYDAKSAQNRDLIESSNDPEKRFRILLTTRNEFTAALGREIIRLSDRLQKCELERESQK